MIKPLLLVEVPATVLGSVIHVVSPANDLSSSLACNIAHRNSPWHALLPPRPSVLLW